MQTQKVIIIELLGKHNVDSVIEELSKIDYEVLIIKRLIILKDEKYILSSLQLPYNLKKLIIFEYLLGVEELGTIEDHLNYLFKIPFGCEIVNFKYKINFNEGSLTEYKYYSKKIKNLKNISCYELKNFLDKNIIYESYQIKDMTNCFFGNDITSLILSKDFYIDEDNKKYLLIGGKTHF